MFMIEILKVGRRGSRSPDNASLSFRVVVFQRTAKE